VNYYWSNEWDETLYIKLAQLGFISTSYDTLEGLVLLPELQFEYGMLDFDNLHIASKVQKLIIQDNFQLSFDTHFNEVLQKIQHHHQKYNWMKDEYGELMKKLHSNQNSYENFKLHSIELISKQNNELVAGEIGYSIGETYTSLSGFSSREKRYNNCGKLQLVLLAKHLQKQGYAFWNLGHPHMRYKKQLGVNILTRAAFLQRWQSATVNQVQKLF
jgi:Leu/Phe-tRNA-protein transferase